MRRGFVVRDVEGPAQVVVAFFRKGYVRIGQPEALGEDQEGIGVQCF